MAQIAQKQSLFEKLRYAMAARAAFKVARAQFDRFPYPETGCEPRANFALHELEQKLEDIRRRYGIKEEINIGRLWITPDGVTGQSMQWALAEDAPLYTQFRAPLALFPKEQIYMKEMAFPDRGLKFRYHVAPWIEFGTRGMQVLDSLDSGPRPIADYQQMWLADNTDTTHRLVEYRGPEIDFHVRGLHEAPFGNDDAKVKHPYTVRAFDGALDWPEYSSIVQNQYIGRRPNLVPKRRLFRATQYVTRKSEMPARPARGPSPHRRPHAARVFD